MKCIYKYDVWAGHMNTMIEAPIIKPLYVDYQNGSSYLWAVVDTDKEPEEWLVSCIGDETDIGGIYGEVDLDSYLNTTVESSYPFVWHWFCRKYIQGFDV